MSKVELVCVSKPVGDLEKVLKDIQDLPSYMARVSNPENQMNTETSERLLKYLVTHKHWSPLEMVSLTMEIQTTRDIARQILRHRSFSFQEFSQRYALATGFETREARLQDPKNRQNSIEIDERDGDLGREFKEKWQYKQERVLHLIQETYDWAIDSGMAKEQARAVLPEGLTQSTMYMAGTLRSWVHYCQLRTGPETQKEHRIVAQQCWDIICEQYPSVANLISETE